MKLKTYRAYTMAEALAAVKRDLGADAVIVQTRTSRQGGLFGIGRKTIVEVTASPREEQQKPRKQAASRRTAPVAAKKAYAAAGLAKPSPGEGSATSQQRVDALAEMLRRSLEEKTRQRSVQPAKPSETPAPTVLESKPVQIAPPVDEAKPSNVAPPPARFIPVEPAPQPVPVKLARPKSAVDQPPTPASRATSVGAPRETESAPPVARRYVLQSEKEQAIRPDDPSIDSLPLFNNAPAERPKPAIAPPRERASSSAQPDAVQEEMAAIRKMVGQILDRQAVSGSRSAPRAPGQLFDMYTHLIAQEMSEELAENIVREVERSLEPDQLDDSVVVRGAVLEQLRAFIPISREPVTTAPSSGPLRLALIGPTGVGKTTTVAKLAATFKLKQRKKVGLITSDTYRIAAVEQLRTYANIIGLRLEVALTPAEMAQACHALRDCDVILIDTAGRSQRDRDKLGELQKFLAAADPHEVHLVLSSTASEKVLLQEAEAFSDVRADKIILTKLDEAVSFGMLVNVMKRVGKELSFVTTGQEVPDHIEPGRADRLAELVLEGALQG